MFLPEARGTERLLKTDENIDWCGKLPVLRLELIDETKQGKGRW